MFGKASTINKKFDPLVVLAFLSLILWLAANSLFGIAKGVRIPPEPHMLKEVTVQIDSVGAGPSWRSLKKRDNVSA